MASHELTYFTCTLGEASQPHISRPYRDVASLITSRAKPNPDQPAIAFYTTNDSFTAHAFTFHDIHQCCRYMAKQLSHPLTEYATHRTQSTVGLLMASSPEFLFTWLGLIYLGHPVLIIAPQCSETAIAHLCKSRDVPILFVDNQHHDLGSAACVASQAQYGPAELRLSSLNVPWLDVRGLAKTAEQQQVQAAEVEPHDIAYLHHTSGTSSGLPKPIPQTHRGAVGVLPALAGKVATFTTTPLYHGGPADIFRAWASGAMLWLFPSNEIPVTARNVVKCLEVAGRCEKTKECPVKYFTSVPYILQMMAADTDGLAWLRRMDLVGVGGAALPAKIGDELVRQGVNLVSRFGSAECGFLLSSHRDYEKDKEWQYLRQYSDQIKFEERDGLHELIVGAEWPHMAKRNREDGSFATADLFERHETISNAWRYHSRADAQITLSTGKKFDPAPIEHDIVAASEDVGDALIFGNGQLYAGVLLFRSAKASETVDEDFMRRVKSIVQDLNSRNPPHARIAQDMVIPMALEANALQKSSKGTVMRGKAEAHFARNIEEAYTSQKESQNVSDEKLEQAIRDLVANTVGKEISEDDQDLFSNGVDSVACMQIRKGLKRFLPDNATELPLTIVEDSVTIPVLAESLRRLRRGEATGAVKSDQEIQELVESYSELTTKPQQTIPNGIHEELSTALEGQKTILITGATGFLGSHVLAQLLQDPNISHVYILIRGATQNAARERVRKALETRKLTSEALDTKATVLQCSLNDKSLGLDPNTLETLRKHVDLVLHLAWSVNFLIATGSFKPHFQGLQNLMNFILSCEEPRTPRLVFCSSVAAVSNSSSSEQKSNTPEGIVHDSKAAGSTGYAKSKLTAELILHAAAMKVRSLQDRITIIRVGQLSADSQHGVWNASEAYPQILAAAKLTNGMVPDLGSEERLTWLPVDVAARAFLDASFIDPEIMGNLPTEHVRHKLGASHRTNGHIESNNVGGVHDQADVVKVLHLINPEASYTFTDFLKTLVKVQSKGDQHDEQWRIKIVPAEQWLDSLNQISTKSETGHPLLRLLPFWKQVYIDRQPASDQPPKLPSLVFDMHNSLLTMPSLMYWLGLNTKEGSRSRSSIDDQQPTRHSELLREDHVRNVWTWVEQNVG